MESVEDRWGIGELERPLFELFVIQVQSRQLLARVGDTVSFTKIDTISGGRPILRFQPRSAAVGYKPYQETAAVFKEIKLNRWRQFQDVNIELDNRLTVLTGGRSQISNAIEARKMSLESWCRKKHRWEVPMGESLANFSLGTESQRWPIILPSKSGIE